MDNGRRLDVKFPRQGNEGQGNKFEFGVSIFVPIHFFANYWGVWWRILSWSAEETPFNA